MSNDLPMPAAWETGAVAKASVRSIDESPTRTALLDAAEKLMVEDGYAAVTTRRVATTAGANSGLISYYFGTLDNLFIELFRRRSVRSLERLNRVLDDPQPLWSFWEYCHDFSGNAIVMEFIALANHRKGLKKELATYSQTHRQLQIARLTTALEGYGIDLDRWPVSALLVLMSATARFLLIEEGVEVDIGHVEVVSLIEREIRALEGDRRRTEDAGAPAAS
jgi:AcrR family transcriptional regulator